MPTTMNIMQVCDAITEALRARGFFDQGGDDGTRAEMIGPAVEIAGAKLGAKLTLGEPMPHGGHTVLAEGIPGVVTVIPQRKLDHAGKGGSADSVDPDFGVTWALT